MSHWHHEAMKTLFRIALLLVIWWQWPAIRDSREVQHLMTQYKAQLYMAQATVRQFADKLDAATDMRGRR